LHDYGRIYYFGGLKESFIEDNFREISCEKCTIKLLNKLAFQISPFLDMFSPDDMVVSTKIDEDTFTVYNVDKNIGIRLENSGWTIFTCNISENINHGWKSQKRQLEISGHCVTIGEDQITTYELSHQKRYFAYYYHSEGYDCGWTQQGPLEKTVDYLQTYGSIHPIEQMGKLFEKIARKWLNIKHDEDREHGYDYESSHSYEESCSSSNSESE